MINLLTPESKKHLAKEYYHRLVVVILVICIFLIAVAFILLVPSYFLTLEKSEVYLNKMSELQESEEFKENQEFRQTLTDATKKVQAFTGLDEYLVSESILQPFLEYVDSDRYNIRINQLVYEINEDGRFMGAQGVAGVRDDLLLFIDTLKEDPRFREVDIPVSNFVLNTNVDFQMTLEILEQEESEQGTPEEVVSDDAEEVAVEGDLEEITEVVQEEQTTNTTEEEVEQNEGLSSENTTEE